MTTVPYTSRTTVTRAEPTGRPWGSGQHQRRMAWVVTMDFGTTDARRQGVFHRAQECSPGPHRHRSSMSPCVPDTDVAAVRHILNAPGGELRRLVEYDDGEPVALIRTWSNPDRAEVVAPFHQYDLDEALREDVLDASGTWDALGAVGWLLQRGFIDEAKSICL